MTPSAIKTICAGVVLVAAARPGTSAVGSPPDAALAGAVNGSAEVPNDSAGADGSLGGDFMAMFTSFEVVLINLASGMVVLVDN